MFLRKLGCRRTAWGAALLVLCFGLLAPLPALADDQWPDIRSDYREGRFQSAIARLERLVAANPQDREAYYYLGLINWRIGNLPAAADAYKHVLALDPNGPFGQDARMWLNNYASQNAMGPTPGPTPTPGAGEEVFPIATPTPSAAAPSPAPATPMPVAPRPRPRPTAHPHPTAKPAPWLQAEPKESTNRPRGMNARPGYFKGADGTFEFIPPRGFILLDEGIDGNEWHVLFGPADTMGMANAVEQPPTLLIVWRELAELKHYKPDQRAARERQLLAIEAATYGPGAKSEARYGVPVLRVAQRHGAWAADTLLFFKNDRLYAFTYGGDATLLPRFRAQVDQSWKTPIFYH